ncbi:TetR/AcrR family transcriptional regulator [Paenibacillus sp. DMB20]|uniref:TetR/AcrR family transcriptional regulator n=1 Tax=Paenibacillus sp. DMB20 TaxID=1642570 RepID=UPI000627E79E|nr:TetR/AcrR family transcriptional regulator [Paenibacillus sp. DMB20]KKO53093.1 TetR family transcriptional regulator [Paenibacillus sp. DMB20]
MAKPNMITKGDLIAFAKACLADQGIERFTLRAVADRAGVTQGTVYYHFRTKEQLLLDMVKDICERSWDELSGSRDNVVKHALDTAKSRCSGESFYHTLFFTLMVAGLNHEKVREQIGDLLQKENKALADNLTRIWSRPPVKGIPLETWGVLLNAIVDGLALQALMIKDFPVDRMYEALELLFGSLSHMTDQEEVT